MVTVLTKPKRSMSYTFLECLGLTMDTQINMAEIRDLALDNLRRGGAEPCSMPQLGRAVLDALVQSGVDLKQGPSLEEMKALLADVARRVRSEAEARYTAA